MTMAGMLSTGCDSLIYDDQGDCSVHYNVSFTDTISADMAFADAFSSQVKSLTLYLFDTSGQIVTTKTETGEALAAPGYTMELDVLPGTYDLLVWAEGESPVDNPTAFTIGDGNSTTAITSLTATLPLSGSAGSLYCDRDITPLFHSLVRNVEFPDTYGNVNVVNVNLTRDTNIFKVLIQSIDGTEIDPGEFTFSILADNSDLSYTNEVTSTTPFSYLPWQVTRTSASFDRPEGRPIEEVNGLLAEMTTGRLTVDRTPKLVIHRNSDDMDIIRINLIDYLLMVKGEYNRRLTNQQYLDYTTSFTIMFFLDADRNWYTAGGIYINGWRIVPPQEEIIG